MNATAAGLFEDANAAEQVSNALMADGIPAESIRVLTGPVDLSTENATSTPWIDFGAGLARDLHAMGASDEECEGYVASIRGGDALVFVSGTQELVDTAVETMNAHDAMRIEEFAMAVPTLPSIHVGEVGSGNISAREDRARAGREGARVFTW